MDTDPQTRWLHIVPIPAHPDDRWRLTDPYIEEVWSEIIGPTATMMARRFGRLIEQRPAGVKLDRRDLADSLGVSETLVNRALHRLNRFGVVSADIDRSIVGVSGYAPPVDGPRLVRLSAGGRAAHEIFSRDARRSQSTQPRDARTRDAAPFTLSLSE